MTNFVAPPPRPSAKMDNRPFFQKQKNLQTRDEF